MRFCPCQVDSCPQSWQARLGTRQTACLGHLPQLCSGRQCQAHSKSIEYCAVCSCSRKDACLAVQCNVLCLQASTADKCKDDVLHRWTPCSGCWQPLLRDCIPSAPCLQVVRWADLIFAGIFSAEILVQSVARNALLGPDGGASPLQTPCHERSHELNRIYRKTASSKPKAMEFQPLPYLQNMAFSLGF